MNAVTYLIVVSLDQGSCPGGIKPSLVGDPSTSVLPVSTLPPGMKVITCCFEDDGNFLINELRDISFSPVGVAQRRCISEMDMTQPIPLWCRQPVVAGLYDRLVGDAETMWAQWLLLHVERYPRSREICAYGVEFDDLKRHLRAPRWRIIPNASWREAEHLDTRYDAA